MPGFRCHKASGQGFIEVEGHRHYLGRYDLSATREKYHRFIAEWLANGRRLPVSPDDITIVELLDRFFSHADTYYRRPDGSHSSEIKVFRLALRPLKELYGTANVADFGPRGLKAVRDVDVPPFPSKLLLGPQATRPNTISQAPSDHFQRARGLAHVLQAAPHPNKEPQCVLGLFRCAAPRV